MFVWIDSYCAADPTKPISQATIALLLDLNKGGAVH
jgi:hypothetical protein